MSETASPCPNCDRIMSIAEHKAFCTWCGYMEGVSPMPEALPSQRRHRPAVAVLDDAAVETVAQYAIKLPQGEIIGATEPYMTNLRDVREYIDALDLPTPYEIVVRTLTVVTGPWSLMPKET